MSASWSSKPAPSKIPPDLSETLGEGGEALLGFGGEHGGSFRDGRPAPTAPEEE
jgi:hypothetical protein